MEDISTIATFAATKLEKLTADLINKYRVHPSLHEGIYKLTAKGRTDVLKLCTAGGDHSATFVKTLEAIYISSAQDQRTKGHLHGFCMDVLKYSAYPVGKILQLIKEKIPYTKNAMKIVEYRIQSFAKLSVKPFDQLMEKKMRDNLNEVISNVKDQHSAAYNLVNEGISLIKKDLRLNQWAGNNLIEKRKLFEASLLPYKKKADNMAMTHPLLQEYQTIANDINSAGQEAFEHLYALIFLLTDSF